MHRPSRLHVAVELYGAVSQKTSYDPLEAHERGWQSLADQHFFLIPLALSAGMG
jgi:hypothetical protein